MYLFRCAGLEPMIMYLKSRRQSIYLLTAEGMLEVPHVAEFTSFLSFYSHADLLFGYLLNRLGQFSPFQNLL